MKRGRVLLSAAVVIAVAADIAEGLEPPHRLRVHRRHAGHPNLESARLLELLQQPRRLVRMLVEDVYLVRFEDKYGRGVNGVKT